MKPFAFQKTFADSRATACRRAAFTLVELLTVIAIIAVLAAIIFPAFAGVQENVRRANTMDSLRKIYTATRQFELDNRRHPDYLFGPALDANGFMINPQSASFAAGMTPRQIAADLRATITGGMAAAERDRITRVQAAYQNSLFPNYINDLDVFACRNAAIRDSGSAEAFGVTRLEQGNPDLSVDVGGPDAQSALTDDPTVAYSRNRGFYKFDAFDASPAIRSNSDINTAQAVARYSRVWLPLVDRATLNNYTPEQREAYQNQLVFRNPSSETFLTMTTHHVPKGKIVVIWLNGTAKVLDTAKLTNRFAATGGGRDFDFFRMTPTNY